MAQGNNFALVNVKINFSLISIKTITTLNYCSEHQLYPLYPDINLENREYKENNIKIYSLGCRIIVYKLFSFLWFLARYQYMVIEMNPLGGDKFFSVSNSGTFFKKRREKREKKKTQIDVPGCQLVNGYVDRSTSIIHLVRINLSVMVTKGKPYRVERLFDLGLRWFASRNRLLKMSRIFPRT